MKRFVAAALLPLALALPLYASAQAFPTKPIKILVGFAPGGNTDVVTRLVAVRMQEILGQAVIVENKPGAGGVVATDILAKTPADGYTLLMSSLGPHTISPFLVKAASYDPVNDLAPVSNVSVNALMMLVSPSIPASTVPEFIAYAKANPGKLNYGSSGVGSTTHLSGEVLASMAGIKLVHVAYKGGPPALAALLANDTQFMFSNLSDALPQSKSGKLRALAVTTAKRVAQVPDMPTVAEAGLPGFDVAPWNGIVAPGKTPPEIVNKLSDTIQRIVREKAFRDKMFEIGSEPIGDSPEHFRATIASDLQRWSRIIKEAGIKVD
ncbi:MAG: tripartite tricarboxylate transporter substrate binding protein [Betaproteobacteria bacterium]